MNPEEIKALTEAICAALKSTLEPVNAAVKALAEKDQAEAAKNEAAKEQERIDLAVKAALKAAGVGCEDDAAKKAADEEEKKKEPEESAKALEDKIAQAVNKALEPFMAGLKSKKDGEGAPGSGDGTDPEVVQALKSLKTGEKCLTDFPPHVRRKLEDFSAAAGVAILKSMPEHPGLSGKAILK